MAIFGIKKYMQPKKIYFFNRSQSTRVLPLNYPCGSVVPYYILLILYTYNVYDFLYVCWKNKDYFFYKKLVEKMYVPNWIYQIKMQRS